MGGVVDVDVAASGGLLEGEFFRLDLNMMFSLDSSALTRDLFSTRFIEMRSNNRICALLIIVIVSVSVGTEARREEETTKNAILKYQIFDKYGTRDEDLE